MKEVGLEMTDYCPYAKRPENSDSWASSRNEVEMPSNEAQLRAALEAAQKRAHDLAKTCDTLSEHNMRLWAERDRLREALIDVGRTVGCGLADEVSTDFLMFVPDEVRAENERLTAELELLFTILASAPKLNPCNYDHDEVCEQNAAMTEALSILSNKQEETREDDTAEVFDPAEQESRLYDNEVIK